MSQAGNNVGFLSFDIFPFSTISPLVCLVGLVWSSFADPYHGLMVDRLVVSDTLCLVPCAVYILWNLQYLACLFAVG